MTINSILSWRPWTTEPTGPLSTNPRTESKVQALSQEIKLTKEVVDREQGKWIPCTRKDVTREQALVKKLAYRLIEMLSQVFSKILAISNKQPLTSQEEQRLSRVAKNLQSAYEITGQTDLAANMEQEVNAAKDRAKAIENNVKKREIDSLKAEGLARWAKTPKHDAARNLPVISYVFWTRHGAKEEAARVRVRLSEENVAMKHDYPKLLKPCLEELIVQKQVLEKLLKPGTREHLAVTREIQEHLGQVKGIVAIERAERNVQHFASEANQTSNISDKLISLGMLVQAKKNLARLLTINTPKHKSVSREIQRLENEMRTLRASSIKN